MMFHRDIPVKLTVKDGLELFEKLGIKVMCKDMVGFEPAYHNSVKETTDKRLVAVCPITNKTVDFMKLYEQVIAERITEVILAGTTKNQVINLIQKFN